MRRAYDEPIPLVPQPDKGNVQKPKDVKISLRSNPAVAASPKIVKIFTEFVENTPEAYCRWRCDMEEYIKGAGLNAPAAKIQASQQLLSQQHRTTWDNCVLNVVPAGNVTTDAEVDEVNAAFALTFMTSSARRLQKRYMSSGSIQKPKAWSSRVVASRLTTLNRYLQYLPGNATAFSDEELKDMLLDLHSPAYQQLLAKANYDVDVHTYLELTQYLHNLSLVEETFANHSGNQTKQHGNSEAKAHKAHGKNHKQKKHGKNHCRKHPQFNHTWADCFENPNGKNFKGGNKSNKATKKAEARNMDTDSDADMDRALSMPNIDTEKVCERNSELQVTQSDTNQPSPSPTSTVNEEIVTVRNTVRFAIPKRNTFNSFNTSSKKRRLLNEQHHCHMQTPLSRKLHKVDDNQSMDLTTEVSALVKKCYWYTTY